MKLEAGLRGMLRALAAASALSLFGAASQASAGSIEDVTFFGFGEDAQIENADAEAGLKSIFKGEDFHYGLPLRLFEQVAAQVNLTPELSWRGYGNLPSPPSRTLGTATGVALPIGTSVFEREGAKVVNQNCFACHSGVVAGQVVAGLGNGHVDMAAFATEARALVKNFRNPIARFGLRLFLSGAEMKELAGYVDHLENIILPSIQARTRGENYGPFVVWRLIARMKNPASGFELYAAGEKAPLESLLQRELPPVDPSPWWHFKYKERGFWTRDVTKRSYPTFALNLMDPHPDNGATYPERMKRVAKQLAFAVQAKAPAYPWRESVDASLAEEGRLLFHGEKDIAAGGKLPCARCHGTYDDAGKLTSFPNRDRIPIKVLGTDPAYASLLHDVFKPLYDHFENSKFIPDGSTEAIYPETVGYAPPPLVGVWASAPYFHNGSVPTVTEVLDSKSRPELWQKSLDPMAYDATRLGYEVTRLTPEQADAIVKAASGKSYLSNEAIAVRSVYDTRYYGRHNSGHRFGDAMSKDERRAVVEYLKLL